MKKINFNVEAKDFKGELLMIPVQGMPNTSRTVNIADELAKLLFFGTEGGIDRKLREYKLGHKLFNGDAEYTAEELALLKETAGKGLCAGIAGLVVEMVEGE